VVITGALQNPSGRMVFGRLDKEAETTSTGKTSSGAKPPRKNRRNERPTSGSR